MVALLVGMGALLLAIIVSTLLDPSPARKDPAGDDLYSTEEPVPAVGPSDPYIIIHHPTDGLRS